MSTAAAHKPIVHFVRSIPLPGGGTGSGPQRRHPDHTSSACRTTILALGKKNHPHNKRPPCLLRISLSGDGAERSRGRLAPCSAALAKLARGPQPGRRRRKRKDRSARSY